METKKTETAEERKSDADGTLDGRKQEEAIAAS
jgi:hypothetical protein